VRRFYLQRIEDASGVSGTGIVAEGCEFDTKWCAMTWLQTKCALSFYPDIETIEAIHGHEGRTKVVWIDDDTSFKVDREDKPGRRTALTVKGVRRDGRRAPSTVSK